ncbi:lysophospholipid acyltransferase family protein [Vogesella sp. XCS3]|uniref:lysophospholipid acyltransferase family protein n=1 Tax=Vogesella sp. XCS3 TaxID=2877939 RepID=UPI001D0B3C48|nr:lysophospholipid acyltransferase family protein [Vogesella sp. XCS3]UDM16678.1 lysophospholipid acyltransferase family protein [Vogesella sp. XCS3]
MTRLARLILQALASLPLPVLHALGSLLGRMLYYASPRVRSRIRENLDTSKIAGSYQLYQALVKQSAAESGKGMLELSIAWCREPAYMISLVKQCHGWEHVEAALAAGKGLIFVTPHLGSYDIAGRYLSSRLPFPLTAMYKPSKLAWLEPIMNEGRARGSAKTAPATGAGVRLLMKALKSGEATIILPDQVPGSGEGVWAPFFGQPAFTMSLLPRLAQMQDVAVLWFTGERLANGQGFAVHIQPQNVPFTGDKQQDGAILNAEVESLIRRWPAQYLWSYNRYKRPAGAPAPDSE